MQGEQLSTDWPTTLLKVDGTDVGLFNIHPMLSGLVIENVPLLLVCFTVHRPQSVREERGREGGRTRGKDEETEGV